jgi:alkylresorcinol/alkylpyrone synthase
LEKILTNSSSGISTRQFTTADLGSVFDQGAEELNRSFEAHTPTLASEALTKALAKADLHAEKIDALFVCTCTGYLCPGPSSHIAETLSMRPDAYLCDLIGLGCGAAIPTLRAAHGYLAANPSHTVAVVAVEVSSAAFYINDEPGVLISLCLFGDGAAAAILAAKAVSTLYARLEKRPDQIIAHSGGRDVIESIESALPSFQLTETREVLRRHGNMSSPSVLFALEERIQNSPRNESLWLTAFGAGFAAHSCQFS